MSTLSFQYCYQKTYMCIDEFYLHFWDACLPLSLAGKLVSTFNDHRYVLGTGIYNLFKVFTRLCSTLTQERANFVSMCNIRALHSRSTFIGSSPICSVDVLSNAEFLCYKYALFTSIHVH